MYNKPDTVYFAGHRGVVGSACWRAPDVEGYANRIGKTAKELDLRDQKAVEEFIRTEQPIAIIDAAAKVGGIPASETDPTEFLWSTCSCRIAPLVLPMKMVFRSLFSYGRVVLLTIENKLDEHLYNVGSVEGLSD